MSKPIVWVLSKCCKAHWELVLDHEGRLCLECEKCGKDCGPFAVLSSEVLASRLDLRPRPGRGSCLHSRCCKAHWEIVGCDDGTARLVCERCGQDEPEVTVKLTDWDGKPRCDVCEGKT